MPEVHIREHLLQLVWEKQYVRSDHLVTTDGRAVTVVRPGTVSLEPGPDIREAHVRIGDTLYVGDIEIHRTMPEWNSHGHDEDHRYNSVVLHVVLDVPPADAITLNQHGRTVPVLVLGEVLDRSLEVIRIDASLDEQDLRSGRLHCTGQNDHVPAGVLTALLDRLAAERIELKLRRFEERIHELARTSSRSVREHRQRWSPLEDDPEEIPPPYADVTLMELSRREIWEQVLYEGCMEGLGYSRNRRPFMKLGHILPLDRIGSLARDSVATEALLFGVAGLLSPVDTEADAESRTYLHVLRQEWRTMQPLLGSEVMAGTEWARSSGRPVNSPFIRLVAARTLIRRLIDDDLFLAILDAVRQGGARARQSLHTYLTVEPGPFWERRVSFTRVVPGPVQPLGEVRRDDLIVNTVAPLFLLYARLFRDAAVRDGIMSMLGSYPSLQPNAVTRRIDRHLLRGKVGLHTALHHQGALQLYNYYCKEGRCRECEVGLLVWG